MIQINDILQNLDNNPSYQKFLIKHKLLADKEDNKKVFFLLDQNNVEAAKACFTDKNDRFDQETFRDVITDPKKGFMYPSNRKCSAITQLLKSKKTSIVKACFTDKNDRFDQEAFRDAITDTKKGVNLSNGQHCSAMNQLLAWGKTRKAKACFTDKSNKLDQEAFRDVITNPRKGVVAQSGHKCSAMCQLVEFEKISIAKACFTSKSNALDQEAYIDVITDPEKGSIHPDGYKYSVMNQLLAWGKTNIVKACFTSKGREGGQEALQIAIQDPKKGALTLHGDSFSSIFSAFIAGKTDFIEACFKDENNELDRSALFKILQDLNCGIIRYNLQRESTLLNLYRKTGKGLIERYLPENYSLPFALDHTHIRHFHLGTNNLPTISSHGIAFCVSVATIANLLTQNGLGASAAMIIKNAFISTTKQEYQRFSQQDIANAIHIGTKIILNEARDILNNRTTTSSNELTARRITSNAISTLIQFEPANAIALIGMQKFREVAGSTGLNNTKAQTKMTRDTIACAIGTNFAPSAFAMLMNDYDQRQSLVTTIFQTLWEQYVDIQTPQAREIPPTLRERLTLAIDRLTHSPEEKLANQKRQPHRNNVTAVGPKQKKRNLQQLGY